MLQPQIKRIYQIELCSGEIRRWQYLGPLAGAQIWWRDVDSGLEFNEAGLMYAWHILGEDQCCARQGSR